MHANYACETEVNIMLASVAIHSYIRTSGSFNKAFQMAQQESYNPNIDVDDEGCGSNTETHENASSHRRSDDLYMSAVRDNDCRRSKSI